MVYGLPYKGSKNIIAKRIVDALPSGTNFLDCCCGGGAIVQAATLSGKFNTVTGYDINKSIIGLLQATMVDFGKIDYENFPVVSKEEFCAARDRNETINDFLIQYTCSFGNNGTTYLWGEHKTKYKTLMHNAIALPTMDQRRQALRDFMRCLVKDMLSNAELENLTVLEQANRLNRIHKVENTMRSRKSKTKLDLVCGSMFDIPFEKYDVIYFDPPYAGTSCYNKKNFDFIRFRKLLQVLKDMGKTVFVSEYNQPAEGFTEVKSFVKMMSMNSKGKIPVQEKLFYGGSKEQYNSLEGLSTLSEPDRDTTVLDDTDERAGEAETDRGVV